MCLQLTNSPTGGSLRVAASSNLPLQLAVELGVPVAVLLCAGAIALSLHAKPWRVSNSAERVAWAVLGLILLHSMLEYPLWYGPFLMAAALCLLMIGRSRPGPEVALIAGYKPTYGTVMAAFTLVALLVFVAFTAWGYHRISQIYLVPAQRRATYQNNTLAKMQASWLFKNQVRFAELTTTPVTPGNAAKMHEIALDLLHFSPEPRVVNKLIESAVRLGLDDEALFHTQRLHAAFPEEPRVPGKS